MPADVNGLSQKVFDAKSDFTLSGRPGSKIMMRLRGDRSLRGDDLQEQGHHRRPDARPAPQRRRRAELRRDDPGLVRRGPSPVSIDFNVAAPVLPTEANPNVTPSFDSVTAHLAVDSPIDLSAISWNPTLRYTAAVDADGDPVDVTDPNGDPTQDEGTPGDRAVSAAGARRRFPAVESGAADTYDARVTFNRGTDTPAGTAIVSIKRRNTPNNQLIAQQAVSIPAGSGSHLAVLNLNVGIANGGNYWFDVTIRDPAVSDKVTLASFVLRPDGATDATKDVTAPATLHWMGRQGIFPLAYRGWAVAGYNGNGAAATTRIDETAFDIQTNNLPDEIDEPSGFDDPDFDPPTPDRAYIFLPAVVSQTIPGLPAPSRPPPGRAAVTISRQPRNASARRASAADSVTLGNTSGGSGRGVTRVGITSPSAALAFGLGPLGASFGVSPSFGLVDFEDMNGDGYPDIINPSSVQYTTPRGGLEDTTKNPGNLAVTNQDLTFAVTAGFTSGLVDIQGNVKGKSNANQGNAASKGSDANESGAGLGIGDRVNSEWSSPNASGPPTRRCSPTARTTRPRPTPASSDRPPMARRVKRRRFSSPWPTSTETAFPTASSRPRRRLREVQPRLLVRRGAAEARHRRLRVAGVLLRCDLVRLRACRSEDFGGGVALNLDADLSRYSWRDVNGDGIPGSGPQDQQHHPADGGVRHRDRDLAAG